ncbi:WecB/TagA/CpsF family glycosyltransferase [Methylocystis heyeri]|uniref:WecB/TagA/CpsF family glycosyltransferase n=1 Tax=Methylocystis heyeri TaxID=391905 RepID=A0A6B8KLG1_9HYPH|nr:WecB/TagA/CpsF family glycosyltransferase [Methylocystis heyeri]QGM47855.1 WecB/TagA/CpsF family glycosyltransferase [Methylocystis heyeri]
MFALQSSAVENLVVASDISVNLPNMGSALDAMMSRARAKSGFTLFTVNLDHLVKLKRDRGFLSAYKRADFVTADGWPIVWMLRQKGGEVKRTTGADLVEPLCARAAREALPVFFVGPSYASQRKALDILTRRYPGLRIAGADTPHVRIDAIEEAAAALATSIKESGARFCFLSLGAPKQELLADALRRHCPEVGFICVGAALDFISGHMVRAPRGVQLLKLEWLWRLASDPRRLGARYAQCFQLLAAEAWRMATDRDLRPDAQAHLSNP